MSSYPFNQKKLSKNILIREFKEGCDVDELIWHRDSKDRLIFVVESNGWCLQKDNELPILLEDGSQHFIKARDWHRVIKGDGRLLVIVREKNA